MKSQVIPFVKASACGNDFLIVEEFDALIDLKELSSRMCDRHFGIGADGVEWLFPDPDIDVTARLFNADGSEAEISGNGTRCVAAYLCSKREKTNVAIRTGAGVKSCKLVSRSGTQYEFEIGMGVPQIENELTVPLESGMVRGIPVSIGNPHYVMFVDRFEDDWHQQAAAIGRDSRFTNGVNVEMVLVKNKSDIEVRFFERGVGETRSSGTGSCASAVAAIATGKARSPVRVHARGGTQTVRWNDEVFLTGPAQLVCRGEFFQ